MTISRSAFYTGECECGHTVQYELTSGESGEGMPWCRVRCKHCGEIVICKWTKSNVRPTDETAGDLWRSPKEVIYFPEDIKIDV